MTTNKTTSSLRRHDLDALRAVAMLLGIVLHTALAFAPRFPWVVHDTQQSGLFSLLYYAIHGFRMPLFFVMSGFFTAMLWRKRGLKSLVKHRFLRVFLPLLLGLVTIIPAMKLISGIAFTSASRPGMDIDARIAAKAGDIVSIEHNYMDEVDINDLDGTYRTMPLT